MDFLTDNEVEFDLPALKATSTRFGSALAAAQRALESERAVAAQFDRMAAVAAANGDHRGHQFLQWFIEEQVEEEAKIQHIVDLIASGINLFQAEALLEPVRVGDPGPHALTHGACLGYRPLTHEPLLLLSTPGMMVLGH